MPTALAATPPRRRRSGEAGAPSRVTLGPYRLAVVFLDRAQLVDRRRLACVNLELSRIELREDLHGMRLAEAFLGCIIRLSHFSKGCQQGCVEEAYTHSFATGMVEFVQRNPQAWLWFNELLSEHHPSDVQYARVVDGSDPRPPRMPRRIVIGGHPITIRGIGREETGSAFGWYHFSRQEAQLYTGLTGPNLAVVALHELTHAVHHVYGIRNRDRHHNFRRAQLKGWLDIIRRNPGAWRWLAWLMSFPAKARIEAAAPRIDRRLPAVPSRGLRQTVRA